MIDLDWTTITVAAIGLVGTWLAGRASRAGKAKEAAIAAAAQERADRDAEFEYMKTSRATAIEDAQRYRVERDASDAHNAVLIQTLTQHGIAVPNRPKT
ncbi:hypothetical protein [Cellulosimicrobium aquatile]|uniref:hypothetical protein n=1 Tax=Cellulosimicrobium aquatile TaxID=1612203 RepID=UPI00145978B8|nr:hypothetical protein [Cellulosimicrobium aquatile]NMF29581.1 hypothetical protein [Cellulosimicrobium aquatile]